MSPLKIGIGVSSIGRFLPWIAQSAGLFAREGIAVEVVNQQDEEKVVQDIVTGETPIGTPNAPSLIFSLLDGHDLIIVGGLLNRPAFYLAANATIAGVADLKGKRVGINQPRRMAGMVMLTLLRRWGLTPAVDLELVDLGINDRSLEALREKQIDAALLPPEKAFLAKAEGFRIVADSLELNFHWVPLATTRRFLRENRELVGKIRSIYVESIGLFKNHPQETIREISRRLPALANRPEILQNCYKIFAALFEPALVANVDSIRAILQEVALQDPRAQSIDAASIVETHP
jgi:ABC-type nitrate/sulfonate/bicarbonate transport system substrate-binding protein